MRGEYGKYLKQLDKDLAREGIFLERTKTHKIYKGELNGTPIHIGISFSPKNPTNTRKAIKREIRQKFKAAGVKPNPKNKCFSKPIPPEILNYFEEMK